MDGDLELMITKLTASTGHKSETGIEHRDDEGNVDLIFEGRREQYKLKPLDQLYGPGTGTSVSTRDDTFLPLLLTIEEEIYLFDRDRQRLTDATVFLALEQLSMNPAAPTSDPVAQVIQRGLRLNLSLNNYSRQEVRQAIRKVSKSVERHRSGSRGYLEFIQEFFDKMKKR